MDCKGLDAQVVRPDDLELTRLLQEFVPVRITDFKGVDMNRFRFDYDLTFAALMMNADGTTYARFGTKDAKSATDRLSIPGLKRAMRQVLAVHRGRKTARNANAPEQARLTLADIPAYARSRAAKEACAHCHYAHNFRFAQLRAEGKFVKERMFLYPLPENIGVTLDVDRNNIVKAVLPRSPAQQAGVKPGDVLLRANATPVYTSADLQFALNTVPDAGKVTLTLQRKGRALPVKTLSLPHDWRRTDLSWRPSQEFVPPMIGFWMAPLTEEQKRQQSLPPERMALRISFLYPGEKWAKTQGELKVGDLIVGVNGQALPSMTTRQFHSYFRLHFEVGETVTLNVRRDGQAMNIAIPCLDVPPE